MSTRGDLIGDAVADALNSPPLDVTSGTLDARKHRIWRAICNALDLYGEGTLVNQRLYTAKVGSSQSALTAQQLTTAAGSTDVASQMIASGAHATLFDADASATGAVGLLLPGGSIVRFQVRAHVTADDPDATIRIQATLSENGVGNIAQAWITDIHAETATTYSVTFEMPADYGPLTGDLGLTFVGYVDDADDPIEINLTYNADDHPTWCEPALLLDVVPSDEDPLPDGIASKGVGRKYCRERHVHPLAPPEATGGILYTALVPDPYAHAECAAMCGAEVPLAGWTPIATGWWRKNVAGTISETGWADGAVVPTGDRIFLGWAPTGTMPASALWGPYDVVNNGSYGGGDPPQYAEIRRSEDADASAEFITGMWFEIVGGDTHAGEFWQLTTTVPIVLGITETEWDEVSEPASATTDELLTTAQLYLASGATVTATETTDGGGSEVVLVECETHDIVGPLTIVAGQPWEFHLRTWITVDDPTASPKLYCYIKCDSGAWEQIAITEAFHGITPGTIVAFGTFASDYTVPDGEHLFVRIAAWAGLTKTVEFNLIYNESDHPTWVQTPLTIGFSGTSIHNELSGRSAADCHPMAAITPGRVHTPCGTCTIDEDGVATIADDENGGAVQVADLVETESCAELRGLSPDGWSTGDVAFLYFNGASDAYPIRFKHDCGDVDSEYRVMMPKAGQPGPDYDLLITQSPCFVTLRLFGVWLVVDAQEVTR